MSAYKLPQGVTYSRTETGAHWYRCDSLAAGFALAEHPAEHNKRTHESTGKDDERDGQWYGTATFGDARRIIKAGAWPEGVARMQKSLGDIGATLRPRSLRRQRRWKDQGDAVDMARVWAGRIDVAWQQCHREQSHGPQTVTILCKIGGVASVSADALFWRGAAALRLADILTAAGYNVEVEAAHTSANVSDRDGFAVTLPIKEATAPLDLNSLAVVVCLAGYFRYTVFRQMCACPGEVNSGFGETRPYRDLVTERDDSRNTLLIDDYVHDQRTARQWVEDRVRELDPEALAAAA